MELLQIEFGFTDPNDCYDSMFIFLNENKNYIKEFYEINEDDFIFKIDKSKYFMIDNQYFFPVFDNNDILIKFYKK